MNPQTRPGGTALDVWPALPYAEWKETCATLQMWTQIVGKVKLAAVHRVRPASHREGRGDVAHGHRLPLGRKIEDLNGSGSTGVGWAQDGRDSCSTRQRAAGVDGAHRARREPRGPVRRRGG
jgi:hypothetical protein